MTAGSDQVSSRLLQLPVELKQRICLYAVTSSSRATRIVKSLERRTERPPAILRACRELRAIASPLYYREHSFAIKSQPRFERQCPFSKWTNIVVRGYSHLLSEVTVSLYEAGRVYVHYVVRPTTSDFPRGTITLEWPRGNGQASSTSAVFASILGDKYPESVPKEGEPDARPCTIVTDDVVKVANEMFKFGKQAAGSRPPGRQRMTLSDALWRGYSTDLSSQ